MLLIKQNLTFDENVKSLIKSGKKLNCNETIALIDKAVNESKLNKIPFVYRFIDNRAKEQIRNQMINHIFWLIHSHKVLPDFVYKKIYYCEKLESKLQIYINKKDNKFRKIRDNIRILMDKRGSLKYGSREYKSINKQIDKLFVKCYKVTGIEENKVEKEKETGKAA